MTEPQKSPSIAPTLEDIQRDLGTLRNDVSLLSQELTSYVSKTGRQAARDASEQLERRVRERPLVAVAIAMGLGVVCGAILRR
jgi:ElaB/YqjD/DUF883 family membrane-anchored ribosome-binding protein